MDLAKLSKEERERWLNSQRRVTAGGAPFEPRIDWMLDYITALEARVAELEGTRHPLFQSGSFCLSSGVRSSFKIECDSLTDGDWECLALLLSTRLPAFGSVEGIATGGTKLASQMKQYVTAGPVLIVDDVGTTGNSLERQRAGRKAVGAVVFARNQLPTWVKPLFKLYDPTEASALEHRIARQRSDIKQYRGRIAELEGREQANQACLEVIQHCVGDEFGEDLDLSCVDPHYGTPQLRTANEKLSTVYRVSHAMVRSNSCYSSHDAWRKEAADLHEALPVKHDIPAKEAEFSNKQKKLVDDVDIIRPEPRREGREDA